MLGSTARAGSECLTGEESTLTARLDLADLVEQLDREWILASQDQSIQMDVPAVLHRTSRVGDVGIADRGELPSIEVEQLVCGFLGRYRAR